MTSWIQLCILLLITNSFAVFASDKYSTELKRAKEVFPKTQSLKPIKVSDPISKDPVNNLIFEVLDGDKTLGFMRAINTTTGCNSACLPVKYMAFYNYEGVYLKLTSAPGLTKIYHAPFTSTDYAKLDFILAIAPEKLSKVIKPEDMTDALSGETLKVYQDIVVKGAAYSTLRIHLYNQLSLKQIQRKVLKKRKP